MAAPIARPSGEGNGTDWRRTKLLFILAFFGLDLFLGWQVKQLLPPAHPASRSVVGSFMGTGGSAAERLPLLTVRTQSPTDSQMLGRLGIDPSACVALASSANAAKALLVRCPGPAGSTLEDWSGVLEYTQPQHLVGMRLPQIAEPTALNALRRFEPDPSRTLGLSGGAWDPVANGRVYVATQKDAGGDILFNGTIRITVGPAGVRVQRYWLDVVPGPQPALPIISAAEAATRAAMIIGPAATPAPVSGTTLGYYFPTTEPPGSAWTVNPVWQIRSAQGDCYYINAYNGEVESNGTGADRLAPQPC